MKKGNKSEAAKLQNVEGILGNSVGEPLIYYRYVRSLIEATIDPLGVGSRNGKYSTLSNLY